MIFNISHLLQLSLVDLAGSERVAKTGATAEQLKVIYTMYFNTDITFSVSIKWYNNHWLFYVTNTLYLYSHQGCKKKKIRLKKNFVQRFCKIYNTYFELNSDRKLCPSTSLYRPLGTSFRPWAVTSSSSPTVTTSWPCSCRTRWEGTPRPSCLSISRRQTTTKTRPSSRSCKSNHWKEVLISAPFCHWRLLFQ